LNVKQIKTHAEGGNWNQHRFCIVSDFAILFYMMNIQRIVYSGQCTV